MWCVFCLLCFAFVCLFFELQCSVWSSYELYRPMTQVTKVGPRMTAFKKSSLYIKADFVTSYQICFRKIKTQKNYFLKKTRNRRVYTEFLYLCKIGKMFIWICLDIYKCINIHWRGNLGSRGQGWEGDCSRQICTDSGRQTRSIGKEVSLDPKWQCLLIYTLSQENGFNLVTEVRKELHGQRTSPRKESEVVGHKFQLSPSAGPHQAHFSVLDQKWQTCAESNSEQLRESCLGLGIPC